MIGLRFGKLVVISESNEKANNGAYKYMCSCDCGNIVVVDGSSLRRNKKKNCGHCLDNDIIGMRFGSLTIQKSLYRNENGALIVECQCDCGNVLSVKYNSLHQGRTKSCGSCIERQMINQRFGKLIVVGYAGTKKQNRMFRCKCDCGNEIITSADKLKRGHTKSCGCIISGMEESCINYFIENNIKFDTHVKFDDLINAKGNKLSYDFKVENILIECQGGQHYFPVEWFGGESRFKIQQEHDRLKREYAKSHNFILYEIKYNENIEDALNKIFCNKMDK